VEQLKTKKVDLVSNKENIDSSTPTGKLMLTMIGAIAEWERDIIRSRTQEALDEKKAQGIRLGKKARDDIPLQEIAEDRKAGMSWNQISAKYRIPKATLMSRAKLVESYISGVRP
jgi:DNA invertase Pin-like site-specific DNA recombinase